MRVRIHGCAGALRLALACALCAAPIAMTPAAPEGPSLPAPTSAAEARPPAAQPASASAPAESEPASERAALLDLVARAFATPSTTEQDHLAQMLNEAETMQYVVDRISRFIERHPGDPARPQLEIARMRAQYLGACLSGQRPRQFYDEARRLAAQAASPDVRETAEYWQLRDELDRLHARQARGDDTQHLQLERMSSFVDAHPHSPLSVPLLATIYDHGVRAGDSAAIDRSLTLLRNHHPRHVTTTTIEGRERLRRNIGHRWQPALIRLDASTFDWHGTLREVTLVVFWAPGHAPSVDVLRRLGELRRDAPVGRLALATISIGGDADRAREALAEFGLEATAAIEKEGWKSPLTLEYGIRTLPTLLVLDAEGVLKRVVEQEDWTLAARLPEMLAEWLGSREGVTSRPASQPSHP